MDPILLCLGDRRNALLLLEKSDPAFDQEIWSVNRFSQHVAEDIRMRNLAFCLATLRGSEEHKALERLARCEVCIKLSFERCYRTCVLDGADISYFRPPLLVGGASEKPNRTI